MNLISALQTGWRSLIGFLGFLGGSTMVATSTDAHQAPWLIGSGAVIVAAERIAQAFEKPTATNVTQAEKSAEQLLSAFQSFQASQASTNQASSGKVG